MGVRNNLKMNNTIVKKKTITEDLLISGVEKNTKEQEMTFSRDEQTVPISMSNRGKDNQCSLHGESGYGPNDGKF